jgi:hypothetical protein
MRHRITGTAGYRGMPSPSHMVKMDLLVGTMR